MIQRHLPFSSFKVMERNTSITGGSPVPLHALQVIGYIPCLLHTIRDIFIDRDRLNRGGVSAGEGGWG